MFKLRNFTNTTESIEILMASQERKSCVFKVISVRNLVGQFYEFYKMRGENIGNTVNQRTKYDTFFYIVIMITIKWL